MAVNKIKCVVPDCKTKSVSFHRLPASEIKRADWLNLLQLPKTTKGRVCSEHFLQNDIYVVNGRVFLKNGAVPKRVLVEVAFDNEIEVDEIMPDAPEVMVYRNVYDEHNYTKKMLSLPVQRQSYLAVQNEKLRRTIRNLRSKLKQNQQDVQKEKKKFKNFEMLPDFIQEFFNILMKCFERKSRPQNYSPLIRQFALSLQYYSPAGYRFVRDTFLSCLPHTQTIASWYRVIDGSPGFTNETLDAITTLQANTPFKIVVNIVLDGMAIRKMLRRIGNKTIGYTDFGGVIPESNNELAGESLIFMAVGVNVPFKAPFGYFLINGITGKQLAYLVEVGTSLVIKSNVAPGALIFDGPNHHFTMAKELGCSFSNVNKLSTSFQIDGHTLYVFPDMAHMIKLARNFFCDEENFKDTQKRTISWKFVVNLHNFQASQGIHLGNRLRRLHVMYKNQIMKVYLATQLFSASVADAIEFCDKTLKLPDFRRSEGTVEFIRVINDLFDIFNSHDMKKSFYKQPINPRNYKYVNCRLEYIRTYLIGLTKVDGQSIYRCQKKTFVVGMLSLIESLRGFYKDFVEEQKLLSYIPTYRMSQDSVEIFNCSMRSHSGYNTNPSAVAFQSAYKKTLLHIQFHEKFTGNCRPLEDIPILNTSSERRSDEKATAHYITDEKINASINNAIMPISFSKNWDGYYCTIAYIAGYIARRLSTIMKCTDCANAFIYQSNETANFIVDDEIDEDLGYDDTIDDVADYAEFTCESNGYHNKTDQTLYYDDDTNYDQSMDYDDEFDATTDTEDVGFNDDDDMDGDIDDGDMDGSMNDEYDETAADGNNMDLSQIDEIAKKYFSLIKQKDLGGLFYPSDSLYRIAILSDIIFCTALKESGNKKLNRMWTVKRLILYVHNAYSKYSDDLKNHFSNDRSHEDAMVESIAKFYLKMRIDFLNKTVSANSGKRQKLMHVIHFNGM